MFQEEELLTTKKKLVLYGAGRVGGRFAEKHIGKRIKQPAYAVDGNSKKWGTEFAGCVVESPAKLFSESPEDVIVLVTTCPFFVFGDVHNRLYYYEFYTMSSVEMAFYLNGVGGEAAAVVRDLFADARSRQVFDALTDGQASGDIYFRKFYTSPAYFGNDVISHLKNWEVLIDAGAYRGGHAADFIRRCPEYRAVYVFEPCNEFYEICQKRFAKTERVRVDSSALYSRCGYEHFDMSDKAGGHISPDGTDLVPTTTIDCLNLSDVTYIKMDIEGGEVEALKGAEQTIRRCRPKLGICVYHRPSDYVEIPKWVAGLDVGYRLYLRQHSPFNVDTVLYAIPTE